VKLIKEQDELIGQLEAIKASLEAVSPNPEGISKARQIVTTAAQNLSERQKRDILGTLDQGSDKSKANYIVKLVDEVSSTAA